MKPYQNPELSVDERVQDLLKRMTLREKIGQLTQRLYGFRAYERRGTEIVLTDELKEEVACYSGLGTLYGLFRADPWSGRDFQTGLEGQLAIQARNQIQKYVLEHSRLKIPVLFSTEAPHGHMALDGCLLPVNLACSCTFAPGLLEAAVRVSAGQMKAMGVDLALVSALDLLRDPRWGRSEECFGEDPYLASVLAAAVVRGIQGEGVSIIAKHLCGQGETTGGINASAARIGERELREIHLPMVKACAEEGATGFMAAYNEIDGIYCHANHWLLTTLLRKEYGFKGVVMSDGQAIDQLDAITGSRTGSGALALNSGVDIGLWDTGFACLEEAAARGLVTGERIDEAVERVLRLKLERGLFEHPFADENADYRSFTSLTSPIIRRLAEESIVLLKNDSNILPLRYDEKLRVGLIGPNADQLYNQLGDYTPPVRPETGVTVKQGLEAILKGKGNKPELIAVTDLDVFDTDPEKEAEILRKIRDCDIIIAVIGGSSSRFKGGSFAANGAVIAQNKVSMDCGENVDDGRLIIPGNQLAILEALKKEKKPVITVLIGGRPYEMERIDACSRAILCSFYPGLTGGEAIAGILFGETEPSGRLSVSLPDTAAQLPVYYNAKDSYRRNTYYNQTGIKYPFGSGLSYTAFRYRLVKEPGEDRVLTIQVENCGKRPGWAVPQLYLHRKEGVVTSRIRQLCGFEKVYLEAEEGVRVKLAIPRDSLIQWDEKMRPVIPAGRIEWFLCDNGQTFLQGEFPVS